MTDAEWAICEPLLPAPAWLAGKGGRPARYCMRDVVDGIRYLTHNGPVWRALPADFPPAWTIYYWTAKWQADGSAEAMHDQLREQVRLLAGRTRMPSAAIIDSQSVKAAEEVARASRGYDAGKKVNGRQRHIAVDTIGLLLTVLVTAASVQDRGRQTAAVERPQGLPHGQARLGRRRLRRQTGHLGQDRAQTDRPDRQAARGPAHLPGPAPPLGRRAHPGLDHPLPAHRP